MSPTANQEKKKMGIALVNSTEQPGCLVARLVSTEQYYWQYLAVRFLPATGSW